MACRVEKVVALNGEESKLFKKLENTMSPMVALEKYVSTISNKEELINLYGENTQGEPNIPMSSPMFKLEDSATFQDTEDTMDYISDAYIEAFKIIPGVADNSTISGINLHVLSNEPTAFRDATMYVRKKISDHIQLKGVTEQQKDLLSSSLLNLGRYLIGKDKLGPVGLKLAERGVEIRAKERKTVVDDATEANWEESNVDDYTKNEVDYQRIYDLDILNIPTSTSVSVGVNSYLLSKGNVDTTNSSKESVKYNEGVLRNIRPADLTTLRSNMFSALVGMQTIDEMVNRMEQAIDVMPDLLPIYKDVINETPVDVSVNGQKVMYKPITSALFSTFAKQDYDMFTIAEDNGNIKFLASNRHSTQSKLKARWYEGVQNFQNSVKIAEAGTTAEQKNSIVLKKKNITIDKAEQLLKDLSSATFRNEMELVDSFEGQSFDKKMQAIFMASGFDTMNRESLKSMRDTLIYDPPKNMFTGNGRIPPKYSSTMSNYLTAVLIPILKGKEVFKQTGAEMNESKLLNLLAKSSSGFVSDINTGAFLSSSNSMVHPINYSSFAQDIISTLNNSQDDRLRNAFMDDPIYENTAIMKMLDSPMYGEELRMRSMDVLVDNSKFGSGVSYGELSSLDAVTTRLNAYGAGENKGKLFHALSPTQADRGRVNTLTVIKKNTDDKGRDKAVFTYEGGIPKLAEGEIKDWIKDQITSEVTRMHAINNKDTGYKNYKENGMRFNLFKELNDSVAYSSTEDMVSQAMERMDEIFHNIISNDVAFMTELGIGKVGIADRSLRPNFELSNDKQLKIKGRITSNLRTNFNMSERVLHNFLANNFLYTYEQLIYYAGDMAYYKTGEDQNTDINKRLALPFTPGVRLSVGDYTGIRETAVIKILNEPNMNSDTAEIYQALYPSDMFRDENGKVSKKVKDDFYNEIELADGFGLVSIRRYKELLMARGLHDGEMLEYLDKLDAWKPNQPHVKSNRVLEINKGFAFQLEPNAKGKIAPFNMKYSTMPPIPSYFEAVNEQGDYLHPGMAAISKELRSKDLGTADEVVMGTAVKVGITNLSDISDLSDNKGVLLYNRNYRFPQSSPTVFKVEDNYGSQIRNLISANQVPKGILDNGITESEAQNTYQSALNTIVEAEGKKAWDRFIGENGEVNKAKLMNELVDSVMSNNYANVDYFLQALEMVDGKTVLPLDYPTLQFRVDNLINSVFRSSVNRFKIPGHSAVQVSSMGMAFNNGAISTASDLRFVRFNTKGGRILSNAESIKVANRIKKGEDVSSEYTVMPAEVRVTPKYFKNRIRQIAEETFSKKKLDEHKLQTGKFLLSIGAKPYQITEGIITAEAIKKKELQDSKEAELLRLITNRDGTFNIQEIRDLGLDEINLYRIPTQGKNSMLPAVIIDFLPSDLGGTIQVPGEIVKQAGSDFDIDKVYIETKGFDVEYNESNRPVIIPHLSNIESVKGSKAYIHDYTKQVLTSMNHVQELLVPNSTDQLKIIAKKLGATDSVSNFGSMTAQETYRVNNAGGKGLISISSLFSIGHAKAPFIGTKLKQNIELGDTKIKDLRINGKEVRLGGIDAKESVAITNEIGEVQNASLDNVNNPLLGKMNINPFTASPFLFLVSAGHGLEYATNILNAPIVKDLARVYPRYLRGSSPSTALKQAVSNIKTKYGIPKGERYKVLVNHAEYSEAIAQGAVTDVNKNTQANALQMFLDMNEIGDSLLRAHVTLNFDSKGASPSAEGLYRQYLAIAGIENTKASSLKDQAGGIIKLLKGDVNENNFFMVDKELYDNHSMSTYEIEGIHKSLEVVSKVSTTLTPYVQTLIAKASKSLDYMQENDIIRMVAEFNSYLVSNPDPTASGVSTSFSQGITPASAVSMYSNSSMEGAGKQIESYRNSLKSTNTPENGFIKALQVSTVDGHKFVYFNGAASASMDKHSQRQMMNNFERLMDSSNPHERKLAQTLTQYALMSYGYAKSPNSFMSVIPPKAHIEYLGSNEGSNVSVVEMFRRSKELFTEENVMKSPEMFLDMYVSNNADRLVRDRGDSEKMRFVEYGSGMDLLPPTYFLLYKKVGKELYKYVDGKYTSMQLLGKANLAKEYYMPKGSIFNPDINNQEVSAHNKRVEDTSPNKGVQLNVAGEDALIRAFFNESLNFTKITSEKQAEVLANKAADTAAHLLSPMEGLTASYVKAIRNTAVTSAKQYGRKVAKGTLKGETMESLFKENMQDILTGELLYSYNVRKKLIHKIQNCGL